MVDDGPNYPHDGSISYSTARFSRFAENSLVIPACGMMKCHFLCLIYISGFYMQVCTE